MWWVTHTMAHVFCRSIPEPLQSIMYLRSPHSCSTCTLAHRYRYTGALFFCSRTGNVNEHTHAQTESQKGKNSYAHAQHTHISYMPKSIFQVSGGNDKELLTKRLWINCLSLEINWDWTLMFMSVFIFFFILLMSIGLQSECGSNI